MKTYSFEKLIVWRESIELVKVLYNLTKKIPSEERFGVFSQL